MESGRRRRFYIEQRYSPTGINSQCQGLPGVKGPGRGVAILLLIQFGVESRVLPLDSGYPFSGVRTHPFDLTFT